MKITAYFVRIYILLPPTLSVFSLKLLKKFISLPPTLVSSDSYNFIFIENSDCIHVGLFMNKLNILTKDVHVYDAQTGSFSQF